MKKSKMYALVCGTCFLVSSGLTLVANGFDGARTDGRVIDNDTAIIASDVNTMPKSFNKNETVYIITDRKGAKTKSFVNNILNTSNEPIPVGMRVVYYLDGAEISGDELAGKTGHVEIVYQFDSNKYFGGKKVPFVTVTGMMLDADKFKNVRVKNGKIISESEDKTIIAGYTLVGVNEDLGVDVLPTTFSLEADVTDFAIDTTYSFATNELFADLDTSKLNSVDEVVDSINRLSAGLDQIVDGAGSLAGGLDSALGGAKALQSALGALASGANELKDGANELASGTHVLAEGAAQLSDGLEQLTAFNAGVVEKIDSTADMISGKIDEFNAEYSEIIAQYASEHPEVALRLKELVENINGYYDTAHGAVTAYTGNIESIAEGATLLKDGASRLATGADALAGGVSQLSDGATRISLSSGALVNGLTELDAGSHTLYNGLITFRGQGIDRLKSFANNDLAGLTATIRSSVSAARSYHYYSNPDAESVKFIFKTPAIKK